MIKREKGSTIGIYPTLVGPNILISLSLKQTIDKYEKDSHVRAYAFKVEFQMEEKKWQWRKVKYFVNINQHTIG